MYHPVYKGIHLDIFLLANLSPDLAHGAVGCKISF
jgi:hypothetical protein